MSGTFSVHCLAVWMLFWDKFMQVIVHVHKIIYFRYFKGRLQARNSPNASGQCIYGRGGRMFYWFVPVTWEALAEYQHSSKTRVTSATETSSGCRSGNVISVTREAPSRRISTPHVDGLSKSHFRKPQKQLSSHMNRPLHPPTPTTDRLVMQVGFRMTVWQHHSRK